MNGITHVQLHELIQSESAPSISIYMPTHKTENEVRQDRVRFKHLLQVADELLTMHGTPSNTATHLLREAQAEVNNVLLWEKPTGGLAVFVSQRCLRHYHLPVSVNELVVVAHQFHITPLLPMLERAQHFYILALSRNRVRLLRATRDELYELHVDGLTQNWEQALAHEKPEKQSGFRPLPASVGVGGHQAIFYGQGAGEDEKKNELLRYFHAVNQALHSVLKDEQAPLVLAAVGYLAPIYHEVNTYPFLLDEMVEGNPSEFKADALRESAWQLAEPYLHGARQAALAQYAEVAGSGLSSTNPEQILPAASEGRIHNLFVNAAANLWRNFQPTIQTLGLDVLPDQDGQDLLNLAAVETLRHRGQVFVLTAEEMPNHVACAAIFRY
jgi:hypothetical protein